MTVNSLYNFIAVEGNIGAGKTSLARQISEKFNAKLILEQFEDNPFLPKFYEDQVKYAFPLELSFLASRYQQLSDELMLTDLFKNFTIADYFIHKSLIFPRKTLQADEYKLYSRLFYIMMNSLPRPDLLVYLYVDIAQLHKNIKSRGRIYEQNISSEYLENIQQSYMDHLKSLKDMRILILEVNNIDFVNSEADFNRVCSFIFAECPVGITKVIC
ncbi:MAG: deoxynucleoside kinase [Bacteroidales bacterium]